MTKQDNGLVITKVDNRLVCPNSLAGCFGKSGDSNYRVVSRKKLISIFENKDRKRGPYKKLSNGLDFLY